MNKDRLDELKTLAQKTTRQDWDIYVAGDNAYATNVDFHQADNLRWIAATNPQTMLELINEYEKLQAAFYELSRISVDKSVKIYQLEKECTVKHEAIKQQEKTIDKLEKEANCLALWLADTCDFQKGDCDDCLFGKKGICPDNNRAFSDMPNDWREAAREAVK